MKLLILGFILALGLQLSQAEGFTKCTGVNVGLTNICSMLAKMDCYNAGGGCCATYSDGTGTVSTAEKTSKELCGYCFTGEPGTLEATLEGLSTMQGKRRRGRKRKGGNGGRRHGRGGRGGRRKGKGAAGAGGGPPAPPAIM